MIIKTDLLLLEETTRKLVIYLSEFAADDYRRDPSFPQQAVEHAERVFVIPSIDH